MENDKVEETQIIVRFKTKLPAKLRVPETPVVRAMKPHSLAARIVPSLAAMHMVLT